ncbi:MAG TPA: MerR family transcriptional regulator [Streptosporangiaceae bacterium]|jgi:DNA-binding transcriptional MerR regulator|nr:MerR family transcriptional regulator [Streptosporangiaceae bacterium]
MSAQPARGYLSISEVLAQLRAEFPDISVSKIRFLETEGLIEPARAPSGYRRFAAADVERLRYILTAQRDQYLPLRVIKERLTDAEQERPDGGADERLTRRELIDQAGITEPQLTELEMFGLVRKAEGRLYARDALEVARTAAALTAYGVEARHLRTVRAAVEREVNLIEHVVAPILKQRGAGARELAGQTAGELAGLATRLHQALIEGALAEAGLAGAELAGADTRLNHEDPAADRATARRSGVRGASA